MYVFAYVCMYVYVHAWIMSVCVRIAFMFVCMCMYVCLFIMVVKVAESTNGSTTHNENHDSTWNASAINPLVSRGVGSSSCVHAYNHNASVPSARGQLPNLPVCTTALQTLAYHRACHGVLLCYDVHSLWSSVFCALHGCLEVWSACTPHTS